MQDYKTGETRHVRPMNYKFVWSAVLFVGIVYVLSVHKYDHSGCKIFINCLSGASTYLYVMFIAPISTQLRHFKEIKKYKLILAISIINSTL